MYLFIISIRVLSQLYLLPDTCRRAIVIPPSHSLVDGPPPPNTEMLNDADASEEPSEFIFKMT